MKDSGSKQNMVGYSNPQLCQPLPRVQQLNSSSVPLLLVGHTTLCFCPNLRFSYYAVRFELTFHVIKQHEQFTWCLLRSKDLTRNCEQRYWNMSTDFSCKINWWLKTQTTQLALLPRTCEKSNKGRHLLVMLFYSHVKNTYCVNWCISI